MAVRGFFPFFSDLRPDGSSASRVIGRPSAAQGSISAGQGLTQAEFIPGDVADVLRNEIAPRGLKADVVVLDPPRDGCGAGVIDAVVAIRPKRIVYVSCNPATQARDIRLLSNNGYSLRLLQPIDMFPQTAHIEVVAALTMC